MTSSNDYLYIFFYGDQKIDSHISHIHIIQLNPSSGRGAGSNKSGWYQLQLCRRYNGDQCNVKNKNYIIKKGPWAHELFVCQQWLSWKSEPYQTDFLAEDLYQTYPTLSWFLSGVVTCYISIFFSFLMCFCFFKKKKVP